MLGDYTSEQIEAALRSAFGMDTQLLRDRTFFVVEDGQTIVACGGWSRRHTLFGSDARADRDATPLDPASDAARIRAFFVLRPFARRGMGAAILQRCEQDAIAHGFTRFELMATLPGRRLYAARGYSERPAIQWPLGEDRFIAFVPMRKIVSHAPLITEIADEEDAAAILALQMLAYQSEARRYDDWSLPPLTQTLESMVEEITHGTVLKTTRDGRLLGSVRARMDGRVCRIGRLVVDPQHQGCGIGSHLLAKIEAYFPNCAKYELFTGSRSESNIRLYQRRGYRVCSEKELGPGVTLLFMEKPA